MNDWERWFYYVFFFSVPNCASRDKVSPSAIESSPVGHGTTARFHIIFFTTIYCQFLFHCYSKMCVNPTYTKINMARDIAIALSPLSFTLCCHKCSCRIFLISFLLRSAWAWGIDVLLQRMRNELIRQ